MIASAPRLRRPWRIIAGLVLSGVIVTLAAWRLDLPWSRLAPDAVWRASGTVLGSLWPPDLSLELWQRLGRATWETIAMSVSGSVLAVGIALLLLPWASQRMQQDGDGHIRHLCHHAARLCANALRTTPFIVWALLLVAALGPGPTAGTIALALHTAGVLGRLYAQAIDDTPCPAAAALQAAGATPATVLWVALVPAAAPRLFALATYRWEVALREATVMGFVGAGGLGTMVMFALGTFDRPALSSALIVIAVLVASAEITSAWARRRWR